MKPVNIQWCAVTTWVLSHAAIIAYDVWKAQRQARPQVQPLNPTQLEPIELQSPKEEEVTTQATSTVSAVQQFLQSASSQPAVQDAAAKLGVAADALEAALPVIAAEAADQALAKMPGEGVFKGMQDAFIEQLARKIIAEHQTPSQFIAQLMADAQAVNAQKPA